MVDQNNTKPSNPDQTRICAAPRQSTRHVPDRVARRRRCWPALAGACCRRRFARVPAGIEDQLARSRRVRLDLRPLTPAPIDDRIDRMTKRMAVDSTPRRTRMNLATIAKAAVADLRPLKGRPQGARAQAVTLLTAPTIDRTAIERLRAEQLGLAETASETYRAGLRRRRRCAQPRAAPESRGTRWRRRRRYLGIMVDGTSD